MKVFEVPYCLLSDDKVVNKQNVGKIWSRNSALLSEYDSFESLCPFEIQDEEMLSDKAMKAAAYNANVIIESLLTNQKTVLVAISKIGCYGC